MINELLNQTTEADLQSLIDNAASEHKTIEYKQALRVSSDSERKEFLADVSSFANASGGDLIFGISEENGIPKDLNGLKIENTDQEIRRLDSMIREGIKPRLLSFNIQPIPLSNANTALVIRVGKSWISPHRVVFKSHDKFYSRSSNGKYSLDVSELRIAFTLSETITERIRKFRENRISKIYANETPVPFKGRAKIILHLMPLISFNPGQKYEIEKIASQSGKMPPICHGGWNHRYNLDGVITYSEIRENDCHAYTQLYRNGIIEAVERFLLRPKDNNDLSIPSVAYEKNLIDALRSYLEIMKTLKVSLPIIAFLTLVGVKGYYMYTNSPWSSFHSPPSIDRDILLLPEVMIENGDATPENILKPCFDAIWNACGYHGSHNYDDEGKWKKL